MDEPKCAECKPKSCSQGITDESKLPNYCPILNFKDLVQEVKARYKTQEIQNFYLQSALVEKESYDEKAAREEGRIVPLRPRIREIADFAKKLGATKLGLAFCSGLPDEAARASSILKKHGLEVCSVACGCGAVDKTELDVPPEHKIYGTDKFEAACNPILQAELLNRAQTAFNIIIGLCVGHDMLFTMNSHAPVTTLIVKDRFTGHNPLVSLYTKYHKDIV
ncbi:MAG: DUF1847 domain-containing protein [Candidatus Aminicenantes bacterium]|nr:MAG: DUF1847 domain-containing protein [Candidatus Aminicenantes bacterium]